SPRGTSSTSGSRPTTPHRAPPRPLLRAPPRERAPRSPRMAAATGTRAAMAPPAAEAGRTPVMSRIEGMSLADSAREHLRALVLSGELEPGTQLSVAALAARLGISRSPVREAVLGLIHDGLAESTPNA